jgi:hypothetical protein
LVLPLLRYQLAGIQPASPLSGLGAILIQILVLMIFFLRSPSRHAANAEN